MGKENLNNRLVLSREEPQRAGKRPAGSFSFEQDKEQIARGNQTLVAMFEVVQRSTHRTNRECFNQLGRFLADCARIHPMPETDHPVADRLLPLVKAYMEACGERPYDYLGDLFTAKECANESLGQLITPEPIVRFINDSTIGQTEGDGEWKLVVDPCVGTGRFLLHAAVRYRDRKLALYGVELDIDLYRASLVNMRFFAWGRPYYILPANSVLAATQVAYPSARFTRTLWAWLHCTGYKQEPSWKRDGSLFFAQCLLHEKDVLRNCLGNRLALEPSFLWSRGSRLLPNELRSAILCLGK